MQKKQYTTSKLTVLADSGHHVLCWEPVFGPTCHMSRNATFVSQCGLSPGKLCACAWPVDLQMDPFAHNPAWLSVLICVDVRLWFHLTFGQIGTDCLIFHIGLNVSNTQRGRLHKLKRPDRGEPCSPSSSWGSTPTSWPDEAVEGFGRMGLGEGILTEAGRWFDTSKQTASNLRTSDK